ncbi:hypothetical protein L0337_21825 [candidate division KSB1 bacterium]|nr:hypothetical protein [candidate division KSB1 bacterium]
MIVISNSSPIIALSRCDQLHLFQQLFGRIFIPHAVYEETVLECKFTLQKENISKAINDFIIVVNPATNYSFSRNLGKGERGVLNLAIEKRPDILVMDDKKARNEAKELGFFPSFTTDIIKAAEKRNLIDSYDGVMKQLHQLGIYLPE